MDGQMDTGGTSHSLGYIGVPPLDHPLLPPAPQTQIRPGVIKIYSLFFSKGYQ